MLGWTWGRDEAANEEKRSGLMFINYATTQPRLQLQVQEKSNFLHSPALLDAAA